MLQNLKNKYVFYLLDRDNLLQDSEDWMQQIKKICDFQNLDDFWGYYQHLVRPQELGNKCEYLLFKEGVQPQWEAVENQQGGRFKIRVKKQYADKFWEDLLISIVQENDISLQFVNGIIATIKEKEVLFSVWVSKNTEEQRDKIRNYLRDILGLNQKVEIDYRDHPKLEDIVKIQQQEKS